MGSILIRNGTVFDGERFFDGDVLVENGTVAKFGAKLWGADFEYDAAGKLVLPGLVDTHVHMRGVSYEAYGIQAEMSCFPFGVTAAADAGAIYGDKALLGSFAVKNRVFVYGELYGGHAHFENAETMLKQYGKRVVGIKACFDRTVSDISDVTPLKEVCAFARERGLKVMVHCSRSPVPMAELLEVLAPGDILTHAFHGGENSAADDKFESLRRAKERGIIIDTGFAGFVHTDFSVMRSAIRKGILPDTISTDITRASAYMRGGRYGMTMCMNMAKTLGMSEPEIFKAVTSTPARVLGREDCWGRLEEGRCADMAVFEMADEGFDLTDGAGNRIHSDKGYRCVLTLSDGVVVYRH